MLVNNETGIVQPVREAAEIVKAHRGLLVVDAVQAAGRIEIDINALGADFLILSSHKLGGPKGAGALVSRGEILMPKPLIHGGGQEKGHRSGTENSLAVIGFFLKDRRDVGIWARWIAPIISFLALGTVFVLIVVNFNVLLGVPADDPAGYILPIIVVVPGIIGIVWGAVLKSARPATYARIGLGNPETDS